MQDTFHIEEGDEMSEFMCINDRIESIFNAAAATQVAFQQPARQFLQKDGKKGGLRSLFFKLNFKSGCHFVARFM